MKSILTFALGLTVAAASPAAANSTCNSLHGLATNIMKMRQNEVPLPEAMKIVDTGGGTEKQAAGIRAIIMLAYEQPAFQTPEIRQRQVSEFANEIYMICAKA